MEIDTMLDCRVQKKLIKIKIEESEVDFNGFETFKVESNQESLHPHYKPRLLKAPEYLSKEDKCKISIQIEDFLVTQRNNLEVLNKAPFLKTGISSTERNNSEELTRRKDKRNGRPKNFLCSSACIIG